MPSAPLPPGFVHVDLDGLWTLAPIYGYEEGRSFEQDPVFDFALPRLLELLERFSIRATFFIVARDLEHPRKRAAVEQIVKRGHDLGNHTRNHKIALERLPYEEIKREIESVQDAIAELGGPPPLGFRAPGYNAGPQTLRACQELGFAYDGSLLPTRWGPLLRWGAKRLRSKISNEPLDNAGQYGSGSGGALAIAPQWVRPDPAKPPLLRLPLAVSPVLRLPLQASLGMILGESSVRSGLARLAQRGHPITYLLHGMDALAPEELADQIPSPLAKSFAFRRTVAEKMKFLEGVLREFQSLTRVQLTVEYLRDGKMD